MTNDLLSATVCLAAAAWSAAFGWLGLAGSGLAAGIWLAFRSGWLDA